VRERARTNPVVDRLRWCCRSNLLDRHGDRRRHERERRTLHSIGARAIEARVRMASRIAGRKLFELQPVGRHWLRRGVLVRRHTALVVVVVVMVVAVVVVAGDCLEEMAVTVCQRTHRNGKAARERQEAGEETSRQGTEHERKLTSRRHEGTHRAMQHRLLHEPEGCRFRFLRPGFQDL
jgi:uncharacterized membrane protein